ncbi:hypothetical protein DFJ77DRAFT_444238, partial [Powellomyces hirtus]
NRTTVLAPGGRRDYGHHDAAEGHYDGAEGALPLRPSGAVWVNPDNVVDVAFCPKEISLAAPHPENVTALRVVSMSMRAIDPSGFQLMAEHLGSGIDLGGGRTLFEHAPTADWGVMCGNVIESAKSVKIWMDADGKVRTNDPPVGAFVQRALATCPTDWALCQFGPLQVTALFGSTLPFAASSSAHVKTTPLGRCNSRKAYSNSWQSTTWSPISLPAFGIGCLRPFPRWTSVSDPLYPTFVGISRWYSPFCRVDIEEEDISWHRISVGMRHQLAYFPLLRVSGRDQEGRALPFCNPLQGGLASTHTSTPIGQGKGAYPKPHFAPDWYSYE